MPRMTQEQRRATTRRKLVEAAGQAFAEKGFNGASIEQISDDAGLSRGAFYAHFTDKSELFLAVLDDMIDRLEQFAADPPDRPGPHALLDALERRPPWTLPKQVGWLQLYSEFRSHALRDGPTRHRLAAHYRRLRTVVAEVTEAQFAALDVTLPMKASDLASIIVALDEGLAIQRGVDARAVRPDLLIDALRTLAEAAAALDRERRGRT